MTVHLLSFRIIDHPLLVPSAWIEAGRGANVLLPPDAEQSWALLRTLQTIKPPYDFSVKKPFNHFPVHTSEQKTRKIIPSKKTAAIAIFAASPQLVAALGEVDPALFAVDRVEIGRRRDHSWWLNFVELSGATRWSTMAPMLDALLHGIVLENSVAVGDARRLMAGMQESERIKGAVAAALLAILQRLRDQLPPESEDLWQQCYDAASRADHFRQAKQIAFSRLPFFLMIDAAAIGRPGKEVLEHSESYLFLSDRLRQRYPGGNDMRQAMQEINCRLDARAPDLHLLLKTEENRLRLQRENRHNQGFYAETTTAEQWDISMTVLAAMHEHLMGVPPVFLLDCSGLQLSPAENAALSTILARQSGQAQCFIVAGGLSLACPDSATRPQVQYIDLKPERVPGLR